MKFLLFIFVVEACLLENCPDEDLHDICSTQCRRDYHSCLLDCASTNCFDNCITEYAICNDFCPCGEKCPTGCENCSHPLCLTPSRTFILNFMNKMSQSYILSGDGLKKSTVEISPPGDYTIYSQYAMVKDQLHIFGGTRERMKNIMKLEECEFIELSAQLINKISTESAAISINSNKAALICFPSGEFPAQKCEIFNGEKSTSTLSTTYSHHKGKLGEYEGRQTTVGSVDYLYGNRITEMLGENGWIRLADHPRNLHSHNLVGLDSGALLSIGGIERRGTSEKEYISDIWKLENNFWSLIGHLLKPFGEGSSIKIGTSIYVFPGFSEDMVVQRIDLSPAEKNLTVSIIGEHQEIVYTPVLFHARVDYCIY